MKPKTHFIFIVLIGLTLTLITGIKKFPYQQLRNISSINAQSVVVLKVNPNNTVNSFSDNIRGVGFVNWEHSWGKPFVGETPGLIPAMQAITPGVVRYAGGLWANSVGFDRVNQRTPYSTWTKNGQNYSFHYGVDELASLAKFNEQVGSDAMIQVNVANNDPTMWADMVRYTNKEHAYNFKYWELGNELDHDTGKGVNATEYGNRLATYQQAMVAVDPTIQISGAAAAYPVLQNDVNSSLSGFITIPPQKARQAGKDLSILTWHWYQQCNGSALGDVTRFDWGSGTPDTSWRNAYTRRWSKLLPQRIQNEVLSTYPQTKQGVTELNVDACNYDNPLNGNHIGALWLADVLGRLAYNGVDLVTMYEGYGTQSYALLYPGQGGKISARPTYNTYLMYAKYFGDQMIESSSSNESALSIWASKNSKTPGTIQIMVTNMSSSDITAATDLTGFSAKNAKVYTMRSSNPTDQSTNSMTSNASTTINGIKIDASNITQSLAQIVPTGLAINGSTFNYSYPAYSVTAIVFDSGTTATIQPSVNATTQPTTQPTGISYGCSNMNFFSVINPREFTFSRDCLQVPKQIYGDDPRFTFFVVPQTIGTMPYIKTGNTAEKEIRTLSWSINTAIPAQIYLMYRKIPSQTVPSWISAQYTKLTNDNYTNLQQFVMRKNEQGLIGLYDIYKKNSISTGAVNFGPASEGSTTAYSMYIIGIKPQ